MYATMTSKGQLTLPKPAREALKLKAGQRLAVEVSEDGKLLLTPQHVDPLSICDILPRPTAGRATVEDMDRGIAGHLASKHARRAAKGASKHRSKR